MDMTLILVWRSYTKLAPGCTVSWMVEPEFESRVKHSPHPGVLPSLFPPLVYELLIPASPTSEWPSPLLITEHCHIFKIMRRGFCLTSQAAFEIYVCINFPLLEIAASFLKRSSAELKNAPSIFPRPLQFGIFKERKTWICRSALTLHES